MYVSPSVSSFLFQSTPHLSGEANAWQRARKQSDLLFQSTPHLSGEANSETDPPRFRTLSFQSTPHLSGEANVSTKSNKMSFTVFQSTPHLSGEANEITPRACGCGIVVAIHASPQRRGERASRYGSRRTISRFNPRLTSAARRTSPPLRSCLN